MQLALNKIFRSTNMSEHLINAVVYGDQARSLT